MALMITTMQMLLILSITYYYNSVVSNYCFIYKLLALTVAETVCVCVTRKIK